MSIGAALLRRISPLYVERRFARLPWAEIKSCLMTSTAELEARFDGKADIDQNRRILSHIIGIERWGQRRLRVFLGEPFVDEEYNSYRPPREMSWSELRTQFRETRTQTLTLIDPIAAADPGGQRVYHNQWGLLSARGWLNYLDVHARGESFKMR
jgi:hypothetical protein